MTHTTTRDDIIRVALEALQSISNCYVGDDDEAGECASCHERSYKPHALDCKKNNAITALKAALAQEHDAELSAALEVRAYVASAVAAERERCAMVCEALPCRGSEYDAATMDCAAAIRDGA